MLRPFNDNLPRILLLDGNLPWIGCLHLPDGCIPEILLLVGVIPEILLLDGVTAALTLC